MRLALVLALSLGTLAACRGASSAPSGAVPAPAAHGPVTQTSVTVPLSQAAVAIALPSLPGVSGTVTFPSSNAPAGTTVSISTSTALPPFVSGAPEPGSVIFPTITLTPSQDVTFRALPKFVVSLSSLPANKGAYYAWQFSQSRWSDFASLAVSANTLTFGGDNRAMPLLKGTSTVIIPLTAPPLAACPTPPPTPPPTPTPVPTPITNPMYVAMDFSIAVFPALANGNVRPRIFVSDFIAEAGQVAVDSQHELFVTNSERFMQLPVTGISVFAPGAAGIASAIRVIPGGGITDLEFPDGIAVDGAGTAFVVDEGGTGPSAAINVYAPGANGNVAPMRRVVGDQTGLGPASLQKAHNIALDEARGVLYVANTNLNTITAYPANADGNIAPSRTIGGSATGLKSPAGIAVDASGNIYVSDLASNRIDVFAASSDGNAAPLRTISGANTGLVKPAGITVDSLGDLYVTNHGPPGSVTVYAPGVSGNAAPIQIITGNLTALGFIDGIAVDR